MFGCEEGLDTWGLRIQKVVKANDGNRHVPLTGFHQIVRFLSHQFDIIFEYFIIDFYLFFLDKKRRFLIKFFER